MFTVMVDFGLIADKFGRKKPHIWASRLFTAEAIYRNCGLLLDYGD